MKYLKQFNNHEGYTSFTATTAFVKPNVSICIQDVHTHFNPKTCEVTSEYELIGEPSYPSTIEGDVTSFDITFDYKRTDTDNRCRQTVTSGSDSVTVECGQNPSTSDTRTVSGTVDYHGAEIEYSVTQSKFEAKVTAKYNVTDTSSPTRIGYNQYTTGFSKIEIDGVVQPSVVSAYTFDTLGEHTVKYTLTNPTSIGQSAFNSCSSLTSIDIPNGVTSIGYSAFTSCRNLTSIDIPDSVTTIGTSAFTYCSGLTTCTIGSGVTSIGLGAFEYCSSLTSIDIPSGVTGIGNSTFNGCSSLTSIVIPSGVTIIGDYAFWNCSSLTSCTIGSGVTSIGQNAFQGCRNLTSIVIPSGVTSIGGAAFDYCSSLTSIEIPSGVTSIGNSVFSRCYSLTSITIPNSVTRIGDYAFEGCDITSIVIPSGVTSIGNRAFYNCTSLSSITSNRTTAPTISYETFYNVHTGGTLTVQASSTGYDVWMGTGNYYLGKYNWTKVEQ